jgi:two-component system capsular synthesis sensor histidine kinase RcsC
VVNVATVFDELATEARAWPLPPFVVLHWDVAPGTPLLTTDPIKLRMVLKNLLGNAVKFTTHGTITVGARPAGGDQIELTVADTGIGIAREAQATIFEPFRQADRSVHARYGGAGLGLYIVRRLLDVLGGTVTLDSKPSVGSTFTARLPIDLLPRPSQAQRSFGRWPSGAVGATAATVSAAAEPPVRVPSPLVGEGRDGEAPRTPA